ncbi:MAG: ComEC/Rec2 family competence protein [Planctomycetaceae bacterium]
MILGGVLAYSFLADAQPPVLRAVLMVMALVSGGAWHLRMPLANSLALAVLGVLVANPTHLFDTGAQLSFLAVAGLLWSSRLGEWVRQWQERRQENSLPLEPEGWTYAVQRWCGRWLLRATLTLAAVWLFTLPLGMARFHLVSPVGFVANLLLAPLSVAVLWAGYLLLTVGLFLPWLGGVLGWFYDAGLKALMLVVQGSAAVPWGHFYAPGPSEGWLVGFYLLLAGLVCARRHPLGEWLCTRGLLVWVVLGLGAALRSPAAGELRCTFLSVGHGLAVLIDLPNGRRLVYDVGQMENGQAAAAAVRQQLWARGVPRLDCVILSHSDSDHYNGLPALVRTVPVGEVLMHSTCLDFTQAPVRDTCDRLAEAGVPIRLTWEGDQLWLDRSVRIEVLHPARGRTYPSDNAASLVLAIEYAGRRIVLTGDVEKQGLQTLLGQPPRRADVLLAPHHGSRVANPARLAEWAEPGLVVVSGGPRDGRGRLADAYGPNCEIVSTHDAGAITVRIDAQGHLMRETFRPLATTEE